MDYQFGETVFTVGWDHEVLNISESIIPKIERIRSDNNKNWMNLLRLAIKYAPKDEVRKTLQDIIDHDLIVIDLFTELKGDLK